MQTFRRSILVTVGLTAGGIAAAASAPAPTPPSTPLSHTRSSERRAQDTRPSPQLRQDLGEAFAAFMCRQKDHIQPSDAWSVKAVDGTFAFRFLLPIGGRNPTPADAQRKARTLAKMRRYGGFAAGVCADGHAWAIATPSPTRPKLAKTGRITLPLTALHERCISWRADFAPAQGGLPKQLVVHGGKIATKALGNGTVSVSCQPREPQSSGPLSWYLIPIGRGPKLPASDTLAQNSSPAELQANLVLWINRLRSAAGLKASILTPALVAEADVLAIDGSIAHNRNLLEKTRANLAAREVKLCDEQRVQGTNAHAMAWTLWASPAHRRLLLDPDATLLGLATRRIQGDSQLAVLITGKSDPQATAKLDPKAKLMQR